MFDWKSRKPQLSIAFEDEEFCAIGAFSLRVNKLRKMTNLSDSVKKLIDLNEKEEQVLNAFRTDSDRVKQIKSREISHPYHWMVECDVGVGGGIPETIGGRAESVDRAKQCAEAAYKIFEVTKTAMVDILDSQR